MKEDIQQQVLTALRRIIRAIELHSRKLVQACGLTGPQLVVLRALENGSVMSLGEVAVNVSLSSATVNVIVSRLESRGLVERTRSSQDRRQVLIQLAPPGKKLLETAPSLFQEEFIEKFKKLAPWEETMILSTLQRIVGMMEVEDMDASSLLVPGPLTAPAEATDVFVTTETFLSSEESQDVPSRGSKVRPQPGRERRSPLARRRSKSGVPAE